MNHRDGDGTGDDLPGRGEGRALTREQAENLDGRREAYCLSSGSLSGLQRLPYRFRIAIYDLQIGSGWSFRLASPLLPMA